MPDLTSMLPTGSRLIHSEEAVNSAYSRMAEALNQRFAAAEPLLVLSVMNGAMLPAAKLISMLHADLRMDYLHATRYEGEHGGEQVQWLARPRHSLKDFPVLVIDDILDEGITLASALDYCRQAGAAQVVSAVLVEKHHDRRRPGTDADVVGLSVPDVYVFGCGMDYRGRLRQLPAIYGLAS